LVSLAFGLGLTGCLTYPPSGAQRALYLDLRKIVETNEDSGWIVDSTRLQVNLEPTLHSLCQVEPTMRLALDLWLAQQLQLAGGSALASYRKHGHRLGPARDALTIERTRTLLHYGQERVAQCPFWLEPQRDFLGHQGDAARWVVLAESTGFVSLVVPHWIPGVGGGGRLLLGRGLSTQLTAAIGVEFFASGAFVTTDDHGFDATGSVAVPLLLRYVRLSRLFDLGVAPVMRFGSRRPAWPPGGRVEIAAGISSLRGSAFMSYSMLYFAYELHWAGHEAPADHTLQIGTRVAVDWAP
jgi:hypothetical protein